MIALSDFEISRSSIGSIPAEKLRPAPAQRVKHPLFVIHHFVIDGDKATIKNHPLYIHSFRRRRQPASLAKPTTYVAIRVV